MSQANPAGPIRLDRRGYSLKGALMVDFWANYWWVIVLFLIMIGTGGVSLSRNKRGEDDGRNP
ncbi:hypothetical protein [Hyphobacterium sp.]|uniref:hypothetical protein n=1 Tax=Hyphobacterium sp. TaxID=2004662 RepID=UPI003BACDEE0